MTNTIHIVSSGKGNVGKSAFASVLNYLAIEAGAEPRLIDADDQKQTCCQLHGDKATLISVSDDPALESQPDTIWYLASTTEQDVIVDLAAQADVYINRWLLGRGVIETAKQSDIQIYKWWVCDLDPGSLAEIARLSTSEEFEGVKHILVKSFHRARPALWDSELERNDALKAAIDKNLSVIDFPHLFGTLVNDLRQQGTTFGDVVADTKHEKIDMLNRSTVMRWLESCRVEVEKMYTFRKIGTAKKTRTKQSEQAAA
ncbi:MAG: hypothetical protein AAF703_22160 [Cyanobacteria bacterium P01_D01_bin.105]